MLVRGTRVPPAVVLAVAFLLFVALCGLSASVLAPFDPLVPMIGNRLRPPMMSCGGDGCGHLLGTDQLGRDILSRIMYGARISLLVGFLSVVCGATLGTVVGLTSAYFGRYVDTAAMVVADVQLAFPAVLLAISVMAVLGTGLRNLVLVIALTGWVSYARIVRAQALSLKEKEFVLAARVLGASPWRVIFRHLLPNTLPSVVVVGTLDLARAIIMEALLSFLGLGVQPPAPSWGSVLSEGRDYLNSAWWISTFPGIAITLTCLSVNRIGDWLRDVLDPTLRGVL